MTQEAAFQRRDAILPTILDGLFPRREAAKRAGDAVASQAIKILMNSFYGVLGTPACRLDGRDDVEFVGMEVVRRDWTELAKDVQRELYARLFAGALVEDYRPPPRPRSATAAWTPSSSTTKACANRRPTTPPTPRPTSPPPASPATAAA